MASNSAIAEEADLELPTPERTVRLGDYVHQRYVIAGTVSKVDKDGKITLSPLDSVVVESDVTVIKQLPSIKEGNIISDGNGHFWTAFKDPSYARGKMLFQPLNVSGNVIAQPKTIDELTFPVKVMSLQET